MKGLNQNAKKEIDYILNRTASLLLTDLRFSPSIMNSLHRSIGIIDTRDGKSNLIPFAPLLMCINIMRLWPKFKELVLNPFLNLPLFDAHKSMEIVHRYIDWGETCNSIAKGNGEFVTRNRIYNYQDADKMLFTLVILEYRMHILSIQMTPPSLGTVKATSSLSS